MATPAAFRAGMPRIASWSFTSVVQRLPSPSIVKPWLYAKSPAPKLFNSLPEGANSRIGGFAGPRPRHVAEPAGSTLKHRLKTQMLPFASTCTRMTSPHRPLFIALGSIGQPSTRRYGLGRSRGFGGAGCWAHGDAPRTANVASKVKRGKWKVESKFKVITTCGSNAVVSITYRQA